MVENRHIVDFSVGNPHECGDVAAQVHERVQLHRPFATAESQHHGNKLRQRSIAGSRTWWLPRSTSAWACSRGRRFRRRKGAVKLHTLVDLRGNILLSCGLPTGKPTTWRSSIICRSSRVRSTWWIEGMSIFDAFIGSRRVRRSSWHAAKRGLDYTRRSRRRVDKTTGLRSDQTIVLAGPKTSRLYPDPLRRDLVLRRRERPEVRVPDQQLHPACADDRENLQMSMAGRIVLQMDQTKFAYQILLRDERQRGEDSSVDRDQRLRARRHRQEGDSGVERSLSEILQILSLTLFEKTPIFQALSEQKPQRSGTTFP